MTALVVKALRTEVTASPRSNTQKEDDVDLCLDKFAMREKCVFYLDGIIRARLFFPLCSLLDPVSPKLPTIQFSYIYSLNAISSVSLKITEIAHGDIF